MEMPFDDEFVGWYEEAVAIFRQTGNELVNGLMRGVNGGGR